MLSETHRQAIKKNFKSLVQQANIELLLPELLRRDVFDGKAIQEYQGPDTMLCKRKLFLDIQLRAPNAFSHLLESLRETGQEDVARILHVPSPPQQQSTAVAFRMTSIDELERNLSRQLSSEVRIEESMVVRVTPSDRFYDGTPDVYPTRSRKRGIALIVNNITFDSDEFRKGAEVDGENLREVFRQCGMEVVYVSNQTANEMENEVIKHAKRTDLELYDVSVFVFMSHGKENKDKQSTLKGTDGKCVDVSWIVSQFNNDNCEALKGKPKIFIFQMCRGDLVECPTSFLDGSKVDGSVNISPALSSNRSLSDVLIAHATLPGYKAHRDIYEGSWFIFCLCKVFMEHAWNQDVENLLKRVDRKVEPMRSSTMTSQTTTFQNIAFNKTCFLHPGIYEENKELKRFSQSKR